MVDKHGGLHNPVFSFCQIQLFAMFGTLFSQDTSAFLQLDTATTFHTIPGHACASITEQGALDYEIVKLIDNSSLHFKLDEMTPQVD